MKLTIASVYGLTPLGRNTLESLSKNLAGRSEFLVLFFQLFSGLTLIAALDRLANLALIVKPAEPIPEASPPYNRFWRTDCLPL